MAVQTKDSFQGQKKKRQGGSFSGSGSRRGGPLKLLLRIAIAIFVVLCLFGVVNQAVLGRSYFNWLVEKGTQLGQVLNSIIVGEDSSPVVITDKGIYINGHQPGGATKLQDIKPKGETNEQNN